MSITLYTIDGIILADHNLPLTSSGTWSTDSCTVSPVRLTSTTRASPQLAAGRQGTCRFQIADGRKWKRSKEEKERLAGVYYAFFHTFSLSKGSTLINEMKAETLQNSLLLACN